MHFQIEHEKRNDIHALTPLTVEYDNENLPPATSDTDNYINIEEGHEKRDDIHALAHSIVESHDENLPLATSDTDNNINIEEEHEETRRPYVSNVEVEVGNIQQVEGGDLQRVDGEDLQPTTSKKVNVDIVVLPTTSKKRKAVKKRNADNEWEIPSKLIN